MAVHIYTGDGKGKTTCAAGLAARCAGRGKRVLFYQFLKGEPSGEVLALQDKIAFFRVAEPFGFVFEMTEAEKQDLRDKTYALWQNAVAQDCDMLVLDEIMAVLDLKWISVEAVLAFIKQTDAEIVLTGRNAPPELIEAADYVTEMREIKHIFEAGVSARCGIEY